MALETFAAAAGEIAKKVGEAVEVATETIGEATDSFDPDKRIDSNNLNAEASEKVEFNPDDRVKNDLNTLDNQKNDVNEKGKHEPIQNKKDGLERENEVYEDLKKKYPEEEGYTIIPEAYLRDKNGNIVKDPVSGEARRIDFVVVKDGKAVDSVEVTSKTADKTEQTAKENRIRDNGGNFIKIDEKGILAEIPNSVTTRIERRD